MKKFFVYLVLVIEVIFFGKSVLKTDGGDLFKERGGHEWNCRCVKKSRRT